MFLEFLRYLSVKVSGLARVAADFSREAIGRRSRQWPLEEPMAMQPEPMAGAVHSRKPLRDNRVMHQGSTSYRYGASD